MVTLRAVEESRDPNPRPVDFLGLVTFSLGLAALVYGLIRSGEDGWSSDTVWVSLVAAVVLLVAFVRRRVRCRSARCSTSRCSASRRSWAG